MKYLYEINCRKVEYLYEIKTYTSLFFQDFNLKHNRKFFKAGIDSSKIFP